MATYGLTTDGLLVKTLNVIREELATRIRDNIGASMKVDDRSIIGQISGIVSEMAALVWELAEAVYNSQDPDKATGAALDALCLLTGTFRPQATYSTVTLTLTGTPTVVVPEGSIAKTDSTEVPFETTEEVTLVAADAWVTATGYAVDDRVTNAGNVYQCVTAGTSSAGPSGTGTEITDGTAEWLYLGEGTGVVDVVARATETGPIEAVAYDITVIDSQVAGWDSVINLSDVSIGNDEATDEELRLLREAELASPGNTPIDALRGDLLNVEDVVAVTIFVNNTDTTDADGIPPHAIEALVQPTETLEDEDAFDQSIWDALLANVAAGIKTHGDIEGTATDEQGTAHVMKYSRPTAVPIYIILDVIIDEDEYPLDGDDLIKTAITDWGDAQASGKDAVASAITAQAFSVDGVLDVTSVKLGTAPGPTLSATIPISLREIATYDTVRITVNATTGTP